VLGYIYAIQLRESFARVANVSQMHEGWEFPNELPTKICISKFQFPVNKAAKPGLGYFAVSKRI